jgi:pyridoxine/pyridoxamine 5'-phosphate oxidase
MSEYEEGLKLLEEKFGNGKNNAISLATIALEPNADGPQPVVRDVDAYYENGTFYVTTYAKSNKMQQIAKNPAVSIAVCLEWFTATGTGENRWCPKLNEKVNLFQKTYGLLSFLLLSGA